MSELNRKPTITISIGAHGCDFSIQGSGTSQWLRIGAPGSDPGLFVNTDNADLTRLRDVIDAHLTAAADCQPKAEAA